MSRPKLNLLIKIVSLAARIRMAKSVGMSIAWKIQTLQSPQLSLIPHVAFGQCVTKCSTSPFFVSRTSFEKLVHKDYHLHWLCHHCLRLLLERHDEFLDKNRRNGMATRKTTKSGYEDQRERIKWRRLPVHPSVLQYWKYWKYCQNLGLPILTHSNTNCKNLRCSNKYLLQYIGINCS